MLPPVSTRNLLTAIETKRREDAARRWSQSFQPNRRSAPNGRPDIAPARTIRG